MLEGFFRKAKTKVVFLHLPKTAGTSFVSFLKDQYQPPEILSKYKKPLLAKDLDGPHKLIMGHLPFNWLVFDVAEYQQQGWKFISFVRNPVDRCVSSFLAVKNSSRPEHIEKFNSWGRSFEGYLNSAHSYNWQCQFFSGLKEMPDVTSHDEILLQTAKDNILLLDFVGRTEYFERDTKWISRQYGWKVKKVYRNNIGKEKAEALMLKDNFKELIEQRCKLDFQLIEFIEQRFFMN